MPAQLADQKRFTRRGLLGLAGGATLTLAAGGSLRAFLYERLRWGEDFVWGSPPDITLEPHAWTTTDDRIRFAVLGDNGTGGRNQMAVAEQTARTYQRTPYGLVLLAGDISYYGSIDDRWEQVFAEPYAGLIDAGVAWELAIGNHEISEKKSEYAVEEIEAQIRRFGKPGTYYTARHGPMEVFVLDTTIPLATGEAGRSRSRGSSRCWPPRTPVGRSGSCTSRRTRPGRTVHRCRSAMPFSRCSPATASTSPSPGTTTTTSGPRHRTASCGSSAGPGPS
ncbi:MAG: metallophosphoesterase [Actinomycetota bacterium]|nr:metallophosphoesterase [Actinomycetota bacterium]